MATLERAIEIAVKAHKGQVDKVGIAYILHPLRVMMRMNTEEKRIIAILHDVVEDSDWTFEDLRQEGFSLRVVKAIEHLTRQQGESYPDFIRRAGSNPLARVVKMADLKDNMDMKRFTNPTAEDFKRLQTKYTPALAFLKKGAT